MKAKITAEHKKTKCFNCGTRYDFVSQSMGGVMGVCYACDSNHWIVPPSENKEKEDKCQ